MSPEGILSSVGVALKFGQMNPSRLIEAIHCHLRPDRVITAYIEWSCYDLSDYGYIRCQSHPPLYLINKDCFTCSDILGRQFGWLRYSDSDVYGNTIHSTARRTEPHTINGKFCQSDDPAIYRNQSCYICHDYFYTAEAVKLAIPMTTTIKITLPKQNATRVPVKLLTEAKLRKPCLDPPKHPRDFNCPGFAYQLGDKTSCNEQCATNCFKGRWGFNCSKSCINCETACDNDTGSCSVCIPGYRYPSTACVQGKGRVILFVMIIQHVIK
ncbi:cell death abnormality protein 1, partial [Biomphalaria pfeifferi]